MKRRSILIVISSEIFVRNYINTDALSEVEKYFNCSYLVSDKIKSLDAFHAKTSLGRYSTNEIMDRKHYRVFNILMRKYRAKSSSFYFRYMRTRRFDFSFPKGSSILKITIKFSWKIIHWAVRPILDSICNNNIVFPFYFYLYKNTLTINANLEKEIRKLAPDFILFPSSSYDPDGIDLVIIGKKIGAPVLFLVDNWDNLSSKSILWERPTHVGVWGAQSVEHAVNIQGFKKEQVTCLGTPRFDQYFKVRDISIKSNFNFKYILFVGTALEFDEVGVLQKLNEIISRHPDIFINVKVIYRPHPWRQGEDSVIGKVLENVIIDPQMIGAYSVRDSLNFQPDLSYYPSLLKNAEFVIGGLTSMIIEALIFRKRFLALAYDDGKNFTSQHNALKYYTHLQGLKEVEAISFCENIDTLEANFIDTWLSRNDIDAGRVDFERRYFYFDDGRTYPQRLRELCSDITEKSLYSD